MRKIAILLLTILLAACNLSHTIPKGKPFHATGIPTIATVTPDTITSYAQCGWSWATQPLPDLSAEVQSALDAAGLKGVTVSAEAFGENCITASGNVDHFATMETDFRFQVEVRDLSDSSDLGDLLERILVVLDAFPPDATPGPQPGYIGVHFVHGTEGLNLWFMVTTSDTARAQGLHGAELLRELQNK
jgi:hypothetical protein